jgi:signal transduction histidine kinase
MLPRSFLRSRPARPSPAPDGPRDKENSGRQWSRVLLTACAHYAQRGGLYEGLLIALILGLFVLDLKLPLGATPEFLYAVVWGQLTVTALRYREDGPIFALGMVQNITERKRAEALRERLVGKIMVAQEDERRRIARELHDGIGQTMTSLAVGLRSLEEARTREEAASQAQGMRKIAAGAVEEVRRSGESAIAAEAFMNHAR